MLPLTPGFVVVLRGCCGVGSCTIQKILSKLLAHSFRASLTPVGISSTPPLAAPYIRGVVLSDPMLAQANVYAAVLGVYPSLLGERPQS